MGKAFEIVISSAKEDERFLNTLYKSLNGQFKPLIQKGLIILWHERDIRAGSISRQKVQQHLHDATILLLLISADFMSTDFCYSEEMRHLMRRHKAGELHIIPILVRETSWQGAPFGILHPLPDNGTPVNSWGNKDKAWLNIVTSVKNLVDELLSSVPEPSGTANGSSSVTEGLSDFSPQRDSSQPPPSTIMGQPPTEHEASATGSPPPGQTYNGEVNYWAVIVGVGEYEDPDSAPLPTCRDDAKAVARQLTHCGYDQHMCLLVDGDKDPDPLIQDLMGDDARLSKPTTGNIITTLQYVADQTGHADLLLFYYTGHGCQEGQESYLVAHNGRSNALQYTAVPISTIKDIMRNAQAQKKVIILDACRAETTPGSKRPPQPMPHAFIERVFEQAEGLVILLSCGERENSYVWEERKRSVFTYYLLEGLRGGDADFNGKERISATDIYRYIHDGVRRWAMLNKRSQDPRIHIEEGRGDIIIAYYQQESSASSTTAPGKHAPVVLPSRINTLSWRDLEAISIQGEDYIFDRATVRETPLDEAVLREAKVQHQRTGQTLWLKQAHSIVPAGDAMTLRKILKREYQLLQELAEEGHHNFPPLFSLIDPASEQDFTFAHTLRDDQTLFQAFGGSQTTRDEAFIKQLLQRVLPLCEALSILHKKNLSHRMLSLDSIVLFQGRYFRMQHIGLAARKPEKEEWSDQYYQAPEQNKRNTDIEAMPGLTTDIYQVGSILYLLITGSYLSPGALIRFTNQAASPQLNAAIRHAVMRQPAERWPDIEAFTAALRQCVE